MAYVCLIKMSMVDRITLQRRQSKQIISAVTKSVTAFVDNRIKSKQSMKEVYSNRS